MTGYKLVVLSEGFLTILTRRYLLLTNLDVPQIGLLKERQFRLSLDAYPFRVNLGRKRIAGRPSLHFPFFVSKQSPSILMA